MRDLNTDHARPCFVGHTSLQLFLKRPELVNCLCKIVICQIGGVTFLFSLLVS